MNTSLIVRIDKDKKERFERMARKQGKTVSEVIRQFVDEYTERSDMRGYLKPIWDEVSKRFERQGITQKDIDETIKEVRAEIRADGEKKFK